MEIKQVYQEVEEALGEVPGWLREMPPTALPGFWASMRDFDLGETKIPNKYKELIGLAVAGALHCRYCTHFHTEGARMHGATDEEIAEAAMMGANTSQGSAFLHGVQIDYDEFREEVNQMVAHAKKQQGKGKSNGGRRPNGPGARG